ncbi:hypothetical protein N9U37_00595 [Prochlorococcus sp. AH-736-N10]|nr:hypothetical protein [Prochlorococcus sp. AH-736-N10]
MNKRLIGINIIVLLAIFFILEVFSGYALNLKRFKFKKSSLIHTVSKISAKIKNPIEQSDKYKRVSLLRKNGSKKAYPAYLFDPQIHKSNSLYWFGHPPNSLIVYCEEASGLTEFQTNKLGFRSVLNQNLDNPLDLILIGDSFAEGACINAPYDIASNLGKNSNVLNLGKGGSGPLFQFGLINELSRLSDLKEITLKDGFDVVWIIFTGNDLKNLAEERQTKLSLYLNDDKYQQDYFNKLIRNKELISEMKSFHDSLLVRPIFDGHGYGETVTPGSISEQTALEDFTEIFYQLNKLVKSKGGKLNVVVLENHPNYNSLLMKNTQKMLIEECSSLQINCLRFDLSDSSNKTSAFNHLTKAEYYKLFVDISDFLSNASQSL